MINMPYIKSEIREIVDKTIDALLLKIDTYMAPQKEQGKKLAELLTYTFYRTVVYYYSKQHIKWYHKEDVEKICHAVAHEFERRFIDSYEDKAITRNGDVL